MDFLPAYLLTMGIETLILAILLRRRYALATVASGGIIASSLTLPFVWFFFPGLGLPYPVQVALSEAFAFLAEGGVYAALFRGMRLQEALLLSFVCNAASFLIGLALG